jgi:hypothetical protein
MIQSEEIQLAQAPASKVVDFKSAVDRITTDRIAAALLNIASNEDLR